MIRTDKYNILMNSHYVFPHEGMLLQKNISRETLKNKQKEINKQTKRLSTKPQPLFQEITELENTGKQQSVWENPNQLLPLHPLLDTYD